MKKCASGAIGAVCALCLSVVAGQATTITFEGVVSPGDFVEPATPYTEGGFIFTSNTGPVDGIFGSAIGLNTNGTSVFGWSANSPPLGIVIDLRAVGGATFSLSSLDAAFLDNPGLQQLMVQGSFAGGGSVTQLLTLTSTWTTFTLVGFTDLTNVDFSAVLLGDNVNTVVPDPGFDNINLNVSAVAETPLPAALPLFATSLGALGLFGWRRKRRQLA